MRRRKERKKDRRRGERGEKRETTETKILALPFPSHLIPLPSFLVITIVIKRYVHGIYSNHYKATIGVDFALKVINWDDKTVVRLQLWDIAGLYCCITLVLLLLHHNNNPFLSSPRPRAFWKHDPCVLQRSCGSLCCF